MELVKKAVKAGNSSAVILPRAWLNKEVRIELLKKTQETILLDIISIIKNHISLEEIIGIYLAGSYARGEEDENSDIDILIITRSTDKEMIKEGIYSILIVSSELLSQKLEKDLFPIGAMLKEAKPLLNSYYLDSIEIKVTNKNIKWYLGTTKEKINLIKNILHKTKTRKIKDNITYTLILRIKTLYIIERLIKNKKYSKTEFINLIKNITGSKNAYKSYLAVKNNKEKQEISIEEAKKLYNYLKNQLIEVKKLLK
jgi:predicted nucleotidyltransferase